EQRFRALKALYAYQMVHPGKKLNFMGNEFGQFIEWNFAKELDWLLLDYPAHKGIQNYVKYLNHIYLENSPLYELDNTYDGFKWIVVDDAIQNVVAFYRINRAGEFIVALISFSDVTRPKYRIGVPKAGEYKIILDSNNKEYDGHCGKKSNVKTNNTEIHGHPQSIEIDLEGNTALLLKLVKEEKTC
ncbi:MAG: alpha amylase C-terminal domain-containing protein, partial [Bacillota bacterium]